MRMNSYWRQLPRCQRGAALLIMMLILFIVVMAVLLKGLGNRRTSAQQEAAAAEALTKAKAALIAYVVTSADDFQTPGAGTGHLICPDTDTPMFNANGVPRPPYGAPNAPCGPNAIGRLPHSIPLPSGNPAPLSDYGSGVDQQFWYALADPTLPNPVTLTLDGQGDVVAVIIAPGPALTGQHRPSRNAADYLEAGNVTGPSFVTQNPVNSTNFNDKVISIRRSELMLLITANVTANVAKEIKKQLDAYHVANGVYPADQAAFSAALVGAPPWFAVNNWLATITYTRLSLDSVTLAFSFKGCGTTYTLTFGATTIGRSQPHC